MLHVALQLDSERILMHIIFLCSYIDFPWVSETILKQKEKEEQEYLKQAALKSMCVRGIP